MNTALATIDFNSHAVTFAGAKGVEKSMHVVSSIIVGGKALKATRDLAIIGAIRGAENGRYRAAADVLADAFPKAAKGFVEYIGTPWASKVVFTLFLAKIDAVQPGAKGWTKKQLTARDMLAALRPVFADKTEAETVNEDGTAADAETVNEDGTTGK